MNREETENSKRENFFLIQNSGGLPPTHFLRQLQKKKDETWTAQGAGK